MDLFETNVTAAETISPGALRPIGALARALLCYAHSRPRQSDCFGNYPITLWDPQAARLGLKSAMEQVVRLGLELAELPEQLSVDEIMRACLEPDEI